MCWLPILQLGSRTLNAASAAVGSVKLFPSHPLLYPKSYSDLSKAIFFTTSWDSLSVYFFPPHFKHLRGSSSSLTQVNTTAATVKWEDHPELPSLGDAGHLSSWNLTELSAIPTCLRHSSVQSMAVQQFKWGNTLPQLGKTQQKKTKVRGGKKSHLEAFIILFLEFYTTLPHLGNGSETLTNTLKRQKHTRDLVLEAQNRTGSENWETSDLLRPTQSGKKWSFDWNVAMLAQSSYLLHWLQYWCLEQQQYIMFHILKRTCLVSSSTSYIHNVPYPPSSKEEKPFITFSWA